MSTRRDPIRLQLRLDGGIGVVELHGLVGPPVTSTLPSSTTAAAGAAVTEIIAGLAGDLAWSYPGYGAAGEAEEVFGLRFVRDRRQRQSCCRFYRAQGSTASRTAGGTS